MGTPAFARRILEGLLARPDPVVGVVCQPDRPRGRGLAVEAPEVKALAVERRLPVLQPERVRDPRLLDALRALAPDLVVVAAYGRILPRTVLDLPPKGCINVHGSILPRHRGAAPIAQAIMAGDAETGVSIMEMTEEMDAGDVLLIRRMPIAPDDTTGTLGERLAGLGAATIGEAIDGLRAGTLRAQPQPQEGVTFAPKIEREQARLDWTRPAVELERVVRAMQPAPAAFTTVGGRLLKVHRAALAPATHGSPGSVRAAGGAGILRLVEVQLEGKKRMAAGPFLAGHPLPPGTRLG